MGKKKQLLEPRPTVVVAVKNAADISLKYNVELGLSVSVCAVLVEPLERIP